METPEVTGTVDMLNEAARIVGVLDRVKPGMLLGEHSEVVAAIILELARKLYELEESR